MEIKNEITEVKTLLPSLQDVQQIYTYIVS